MEYAGFGYNRTTLLSFFSFMQTLQVDLGDRSYPIHIGSGLLGRPELNLPHLPQKRAMVVTTTVVAPLYLAQLRATLEAGGVTVAQVVLPDGEAYKSWETLNLIFDALLSQVDSSFCGKTGINHPLGKNMIGSFFLPKVVLADTDTLKT